MEDPAGVYDQGRFPSRDTQAAASRDLIIGMGLCAVSGMLVGIAIGWGISIAQVLAWLS